MSNSYGFDFLKSAHTLDKDGDPKVQRLESFSPIVHSAPVGRDQEQLPLLEKQHKIIEFLKAHRGSGYLSPNVIRKALGIDLDLALNEALVVSLQQNPKVNVELVPDPENPALMLATYAYQATYSNVRDRATLLAQVNRMTSGISLKELEDSYGSKEDVHDDVDALVNAGDIIAVANTNDKDKVLFPRGDQFLVELDGLITPMPASIADPAHSISLDVDPRTQVLRGEAVQVGGQWFRVASTVSQPPRAHPPLSVASIHGLGAKHYDREFTSKALPLDGPLLPTAQQNVLKARTVRSQILKLVHGRSAQMFGSNAHSGNPASIAKSFMTTTQSRKRPKVSGSDTSATERAKQLAATKETLEQLAKDPALSLYSHVYRHGCTKDIREMYLKTRKHIPQEDADFQKLLVEHKLLEPGEKMRRPRIKKIGSNLDNDGKPKKRRYYERKNQRRTNTHLDGTEIGAILARAEEKQKQGKAVGDGGM